MDANDDDLALLIPSSGSSFNLVGDAEYLKNSSYRSKSNTPKSSSNISGQSSNQRRRRSSNSSGGNNKKKQVRSQQSSLSSRSHSSVNEQDNTAYFNQTGETGNLSPIAGSSSFQSAGGESSKSKNSTKSPRSGVSSSRRSQLKREQKRREWLKRWKRRRFMGTILLTCIYTVLLAYTVLVTVGPLVLHYWIDPAEWCPTYLEDFGEKNLLQKTSKDVRDVDVEENDETSTMYENPDYNYSPCHITRIPVLFHLTLEECDLSRRMALSVLLGGLIGSERRASDRP